MLRELIGLRYRPLTDEQRVIVEPVGNRIRDWLNRLEPTEDYEVLRTAPDGRAIIIFLDPGQRADSRGNRWGRALVGFSQVIDLYSHKQGTLLPERYLVHPTTILRSLQGLHGAEEASSEILGTLLNALENSQPRAESTSEVY